MFQLTVTQGGRIVIPAKIRKKMHLQDGEKLLGELIDGEIHLVTRKQKMRNAVAEFQKHFKSVNGKSIADELIKERQEEQAREDAKNRN